MQFKESHIRAIRWKLGMLANAKSDDTIMWDQVASGAYYNDIVKYTVDQWGKKVEQAVRLQMSDAGLPSPSQDDVLLLNVLLGDVANLARSESFTSTKIAGIVNVAIKRAYGNHSEDMIRAVRWKLQMLGDPEPEDEKKWEALKLINPPQAAIEEVAKAFKEKFEQAVAFRLDALKGFAATADDVQLMNVLLDGVAKRARTDPVASMKVAGLISTALRTIEADDAKRTTAKPVTYPLGNAQSPPRYPKAQATQFNYQQFPSPAVAKPAAARTPPHAPASTPPKQAHQPPAAVKPLSLPSSSHPALPSETDMKLGPPPGNRPSQQKDAHEQYEKNLKAQQAAMDVQASTTDKTVSEAPAASPPATAAAGWRYLPVPEDEPEPHEEYDARDSCSPQGMPIIGARVRGKKHKHDGTNCDDWFETSAIGNWTILAVADGAGSAKFSRLGSRAACNAAIDYLNEHLNDHAIEPREAWTGDTFASDPATAIFKETDLAYVQEALHNAFRSACDAIKHEVKARLESESHTKVLGRCIELKDLYTTLLVAIHLPIKIKDVKRDLVFACAVGDGMVSIILEDGSCRLLMTPDSGEFSGEVEFLTGKIVEQTAFPSRVRPFVGPMKAIISMTDGVADDYFPNDPGMSHLYADLILNGIVPVTARDEEIDAALVPTEISREELRVVDLAMGVERVTGASTRQQIPVRSVATLAQRLKLDVNNVITQPALLAAGRLGRPLCDSEDPKERLKVWLDSYHVRGSFDDRTFVLMQRESNA